jgi:peptidoglycan/LPS O-acetylase OafA/YrhL
MTAERSAFLDLVRLELAILVIFSHSFGLFTGAEPGAFGFTLGDWSVHGFFLLSGYLIVSSWRADPSLRRFARRRFLRITPAFAVAFVLSVALGVAFGARPTLSLARDLAFLLPPDMLAFAGSRGPFVNGPMWTIHWEVICYVLTPLLFGVLSRRLWFVSAWAALVGVTVISGNDRAMFLLCFLTGAAASALPLHNWPKLRIARLPDVSYGTYLYGWPVQKTLVVLGVGSPWALFVLALPIALGLGFASCILIERPAMALGRPRTAPVFV